LPTIFTDSNGNYIFNDIYDGKYKLWVGKTEYTFSPVNNSITVSGADVTDVDFTATTLTCDAVDRFLVNYDGTVTDILTGLIWLENAGCYGGQSWDIAMSSAAELNNGECGLSDGSVEGNWRLPKKDELQGLITCPPTTWYSVPPFGVWTIPGAPFYNVQNAYWSSTLYTSDRVWMLTVPTGRFAWPLKTATYSVWPVRYAN
jgi:hypothetical protein